MLYVFFVHPTSSGPEGSAESLVSAHHAISSLQISLLSDRVTDRIFSDSDFDYVSSMGTPDILQLLLEERRRLALLWVGQVRAQIGTLMRFHRSQSALYANLSLSAELRLVYGFWSLLAFCRALEFLIFLRGPYRARAAVRRAVSAAGHLCDVTGGPVAFLRSRAAEMATASYKGGGITG